MDHTVELPASFDPEQHNAGHLHAYLAALGYEVQGVSVTHTHVIVTTPEERVMRRTVSDGSEEQLAQDVAAFVPPRSEREELLEDLNDINIEAGDVEALRQAVVLLKQLVNLQ